MTAHDRIARYVKDTENFAHHAAQSVQTGSIMAAQKVEADTRCVAQRLPLYDARDLVAGGDRANITLDDQLYVLRITRAGKLILTK